MSRPVELPNLRGVAPKDLVEKIGSGSFSAAYINWSRTLDLLRQHAPEWTSYVALNENNPSCPMLWPAPVGADMMIGFEHMPTGYRLPPVPQAVMDNRNKSIPYEKISSRDISDTERRGTCMAACHCFGLAMELWAKLPMESGYHSDSEDFSSPKLRTGVSSTKKAPPTSPTSDTARKAVVGAVKASDQPNESDFRSLGLDKGLSTYAVEALCQKIGPDWALGIKTLDAKKPSDINKLNKEHEPKKSAVAKAEDY